MVKQPVGTMSGGEKARLVLCMLVWQRPNLLLLDEPTNHLDLNTREALAVALNEFEGTVALVSHDRALLRSVCDEFWLVSPAAASPFDGDLKTTSATCSTKPGRHAKRLNWLLERTCPPPPDPIGMMSFLTALACRSPDGAPLRRQDAGWKCPGRAIVSISPARATPTRCRCSNKRSLDPGDSSDGRRPPPLSSTPATTAHRRSCRPRHAGRPANEGQPAFDAGCGEGYYLR